MIDIVIPFYNESDKEWNNLKNKYMREEGSNDRQVIGEERYRDWDCFKYWFRCVEKNCPWVNKVYLILAVESQIPEWLDIKNPKLRVVFHNEYIPSKLLPTFNAATIELFIANINDLSDNYIFCNDDYYFLNPITSDMFFQDNLPVYHNGPSKLIEFDNYLLNGSDGTFYKVLNNGMELQKRISGIAARGYNIDHLPVAHKKNFEKRMIDLNYNLFIDANSLSKFRHKNNYSNHVFVCLYKDTEPYILYNVYENSKYVTIKKDTNFGEYANYTMVCFNDTEQLERKDFEKAKNKMVIFFEKKFPNKSSFEK